MQNTSQNPIPFHFQDSELNIVQINEEPWFIAKDICSILGIGNPTESLRNLDEDEKLTSLVLRSGQTRNMNMVNESGLYQLIFQSRKPEAKDFKRWVTHEVLPSIRKHGGYLTVQKTEELLANPDLIIQLASNLKSERMKVQNLMKEVDDRNDVIHFQDKQLNLQAPKVQYYEEVLNATDTISSTIIAKELGMSAARLNKILHEDYKLIYKQGGTWVPYARYQDSGFFKTKSFTYRSADGNIKTSIQMVWTQEGRRFIHGLFKKRK